MLVKVERLEVVYMPRTPFETRALRGVDLTIEPGEIIGLIGSTGSGKSTLLQAIAGLIDVAGGTITYSGPIDPARLHASVGMVFQMPEDQLFEKTVLDDVAFGPRQLGWPEERVASATLRALERVGLDPRIYGQRSPTLLSGGEKRRVAIAGILSMEPRLLLLDEPTAGLDASGRKRLVDAIRGAHADGMTVVVVSHDLELLVGLATRVVVFSEGAIASDGPAADVMGRVDVMHAARLRAPITAELLHALRARGLPVRTGLLGVAETVDAIVEARREAKR